LAPIAACRTSGDGGLRLQLFRQPRVSVDVSASRAVAISSPPSSTSFVSTSRPTHRSAARRREHDANIPRLPRVPRDDRSHVALPARLRLRHALAQILDGAALADVADACGFASQCI
jgi:hypothetical protein